jgi:hypothetical protein
MQSLANVIQIADFNMGRHVPDPISDEFREWGRFCGAGPFKAPVSDPFVAFARFTDNLAGTNV